MISFSNAAKQIVPLTELSQFRMPSLVLGSGTALGSALKTLEACLAREIVKATPDQRGDYKPICFILTDGDATDSWEAAADSIKKNVSGRKAFVIPIACGPDASPGKLKQISEDVVLAKDVNAETFKQMFKWVSASVSVASQAINSGETPGINLEKLPKGFIEKASEKDFSRVAEPDHFIFLHAKCVKNKQFYIMRYEKQAGPSKARSNYAAVAAHKVEAFDFSTHHGGRADHKVSVEQLVNAPACPYCQSELWATCSCGETHCCPNYVDSITLTCPWCNKTDVYRAGVFDVGRGQG